MEMSSIAQIYQIPEESIKIIQDGEDTFSVSRTTVQCWQVTSLGSIENYYTPKTWCILPINLNKSLEFYNFIEHLQIVLQNKIPSIDLHHIKYGLGEDTCDLVIDNKGKMDIFIKSDGTFMDWFDLCNAKEIVFIPTIRFDKIEKINGKYRIILQIISATISSYTMKENVGRLTFVKNGTSMISMYNNKTVRIEEFYPLGQRKSVYFVRNDKKHGTHYIWNPEGKLLSAILYIDGEIKPFSNIVCYGTYQEELENGITYFRENYHDGLLDGITEMYDNFTGDVNNISYFEKDNYICQYIF
jgi:hypothetical protein